MATDTNGRHPVGLGALTHCPVCGSDDLTAICDGSDVDFRCEGCGRCWHVELGYVHEVAAEAGGGEPGRSPLEVRQGGG